MSVFEIAEARSLLVDSPVRFMRAFHTGLRAVADGLDTERSLRTWTRGGDASSAAGLIEGLAAARAEAGAPITSAAPFWRRNALRTRQVAA